MNKATVQLFAAALLLLCAGSALADVHYVDVNSTNATPPYLSWSTAARNIQDAVDAAVAGDEIVVTNGNYTSGGRNGSRVQVDKPLSVRSVNGPQFTTIRGDTGLQRYRCVYLAHGASLSGFTLNRGIVQGQGGSGGGAYGGTLNNCILTGNSALSSGGGAFLSTLNNCTLTGNSAAAGGGAGYCTLNNCTLTGNSALAQGFGENTGARSASVLNNCIVFGNSYRVYREFPVPVSFDTCEDCDSPGMMVDSNWAGAPLFVDASGWANLRLQSNSPCINAGNNSNVMSATDLDGNPRIIGGRVDLGAYEFQAVRYVHVNSTNATPPYSSWSTAATNIQDAVDAAVAGDEIVVTNGGYAPVWLSKPLSIRSVNGPQLTIIDGDGGARCVFLTNGASLSGFTLTNGAAYYDGGGGVSCFSGNAVVSNCVITGNHAFVDLYEDGFSWQLRGGGAYGVTLNNCTLTSNSVNISDGFGYIANTVMAGGGGAALCTLNNCTLSGNSANFFAYTLFISYAPHIEGGGAIFCTLNNCTLSSNSVTINQSQGYAYGGGASYCTLNNGTLTGNSVRADGGFVAYGGGAYSSTLNNCTLNGNSAREGGGASGGTLNNCIVYFNNALFGENHSSCRLNYSCTTPQPFGGVGNITNAPLFVDRASGNLRLQSNSPCINAGNNSYVTSATDLDGNPRIIGGRVDIGAYEFQSPASMISYAWLQQFNLPINSSTDSADPDGDGVDNYHEWLARSDPTNPFSFPPLLTLIPYGANIILTWPTNAVGFTLQSTTNLGSPAVWSTNSPPPVVIGGQNVVTNSISGPQQFYRLSQ